MDIQPPAQQVSEIQKPPKKWLIPISLAAVVVAGVFLYAYLAPTQNNDGTGGGDEQAKAGKTVVVYTRQKDLPPRDYNKLPSATELVVANIDGTEKKVLLSTEDGAVNGGNEISTISTSALSKRTGELIFKSVSGTSSVLVARSLEDGTDRSLFREAASWGLGFSVDEQAVGLFLSDYRKFEDDGGLQFVTIPLSGDSAARRVELFPDILGDERLGEPSLLSWGSDGKIFMDTSIGKACGWGKPIIFDSDGKRIRSDAYFKNMHLLAGLSSPDKNWYASPLRLPDSRDDVCGVSVKGLALQYIGGAPEDPVIVEEEKRIAPEFWTEDSKALIYSWWEGELWDGEREIYSEFYPYANAAEKIEQISVKRYGVFEIESQATTTFSSKGELNTWLAANYPDEPRFEVVYRGGQVPAGHNSSTGIPYYRISAVAGELWVNGVLIERTENKNLYKNDIEVIGFVTLSE